MLEIPTYSVNGQQETSTKTHGHHILACAQPLHEQRQHVGNAQLLTLSDSTKSSLLNTISSDASILNQSGIYTPCPWLMQVSLR
jgi:hypothetical protein